MGIFLRHSYNIKPPLWGSPADRQYAIWRNLEDIYRCDHKSEALIMPLFWGFPLLDYSGKNNHISNNYGAIFQDGSLCFGGSSRITGSGAGIGIIGTGDYTVFARIYKKDSESAGVVAFGSYAPAWAINTDEHIYIYDLGSKIVSTGTINLNSWQTITFVREGIGANETKYYINGDYDSPTTHADSISAATTFAIGTDRVGGGAFDFNGLMAEVRISNVARTADQIALFHDNPWALYQPVSRPIWSILAVATTPPPTTVAPTTPSPTTVSPTTIVPTTLPPTSLPPTTSPPTSLAPTTSLPTTLPPTTIAPTTSAPTTSAPTTLAPTTVAPTTVVPTTIAPTAPPTTPVPTTVAPTEAPTLPPTTIAPTTPSPTTLPPTTVAPTTTVPTSLAPTTLEPTTLPPTTLASTTAPPTTLQPTTLGPTTIAPTTLPPTTLVPTTDIPEAVCIKTCDSLITSEIICYAPITEEILCYGNLC